MNSIRRRRTGVRATLVACAAAGTLLLGACGTDTAGSESGVDVRDIQQEPGGEQPDYATQNFVGQTVTVSAEVNDVVSPDAFTIAGTPLSAADELLILHTDPIIGLDENAAVSVTGVVQEPFEIVDAERYVGGRLDEAVYNEFDREPYIQAQTVRILPPD